MSELLYGFVAFGFLVSVNRVMLAQLSFYLDRKRLISSFLLKKFNISQTRESKINFGLVGGISQV